jgi:hypothetical protein
MKNPASSPGFRRTCPSCNAAVQPGYKFCEICGTRMPDLSTCSRCGTRFIAPITHCDLCGAPVILEEVPDQGEGPDPDGKENLRTGDGGMPERSEKEIPEPATDELLEKFGDGYGYDETFHTPRTTEVRPPAGLGPKNRGTTTVSAGTASSGTVDDALFFSPGRAEKGRPPASRMLMIGGGVALVTILAALYLVGIPILAGSGGPGNTSVPAAVVTPHLPAPTANGTKYPTRTVTPAPPGRFVTRPTQVIPTDQQYHFQVRKDPLTSRIQVIFTGSSGEEGITGADITITHPDGSVASGIILPLKGVTEISLEGSQGTDRVEILATVSAGATYRFYDELVAAG